MLPPAPVKDRAEPEQQRPAGGAAAREEGRLPQHPRQPLCQPPAHLQPRLRFRRVSCGGQRGEGTRSLETRQLGRGAIPDPVGPATPGPSDSSSPALSAHPFSGLTQLHRHRDTGHAHASAGDRRDLGPVEKTGQQSLEHRGTCPACRGPVEVEAALIAQAPDLGSPRPGFRV